MVIEDRHASFRRPGWLRIGAVELANEPLHERTLDRLVAAAALLLHALPGLVPCGTAETDQVDLAREMVGDFLATDRPGDPELQPRPVRGPGERPGVVQIVEISVPLAGVLLERVDQHALPARLVRQLETLLRHVHRPFTQAVASYLRKEPAPQRIPALGLSEWVHEESLPDDVIDHLPYELHVLEDAGRAEISLEVVHVGEANLDDVCTCVERAGHLRRGERSR